MPPMDQDALRAIVDRIVAAAHPDKVVLFGSSATGTARADSDIDLLVVTPTVEHRAREARRLYSELADAPVGVDIVLISRAEAERAVARFTGVPTVALRDGRVLYDASHG